MSLPVALKIARRELRGGVRGFRVFLACLILGIGAIAAIGIVRESIALGLSREGTIILGGDAEIQFTHRFASVDEKKWMSGIANTVSQIVDFRSMATAGDGADAVPGLTQVKAVDDLYPLYGTVRLDPDIDLQQALEGKNGLPGAIMDPLLIDRLGLTTGSVFRLGSQDFVLSARLLSEPDNGAGAFMLGPRTIVRTRDLARSGLLSDGTLFDASYRFALAKNTDLDALQQRAETFIDDGGFRWRDRRNAAPGIAEFVDRLGSFLVLVGLAGIAVGGVGISTAVGAYLDEKTRVIATLKTLGATGRLIFQIYMLQIGALGVLGIILGLTIGAAAPLILAPLIEPILPVRAVIGLHLRPLVEAATYGVLSTILFTIWPLSRTVNIRVAALFRDSTLGLHGLPQWRYLLFAGAVLAAFTGSIIWFSSSWKLAVWSLLGIAGVFVALVGLSQFLRIASRRLAKSHRIIATPMLRLALSTVGGPNNGTTSVVLSLGLGLAVLASIGQIDSNLRSAIARDLPKVAPSFFVVDIQSHQVDDFRRQVNETTGVSRLRLAPMLRGVITQINGRPAAETAGDHWVIAGDRGITFSASKPAGTKITKGTWWGENYTGPPQISFAATEAAEIGLKLGDTLSVNVLGREIQATITSFRDVDFSSARMGFVLTMNPSALSGAPHTYLATIYADKPSESGLLRNLSKSFPNITMISVRAAIERVAGVLRGIAAAITYGALATLLIGFVVLIGTAATGARSREYEVSILKTLGATRKFIAGNFMLRSLVLGIFASAIAVAWAAVAGWAVMELVMESEYTFDPLSALVIVVLGVTVTILAGVTFSLKALNTKPSTILRSFD